MSFWLEQLLTSPPRPAPFVTFASFELREACRGVREREYGTVGPCDVSGRQLSFVMCICKCETLRSYANNVLPV